MDVNVSYCVEMGYTVSLNGSFSLTIQNIPFNRAKSYILGYSRSLCIFSNYSFISSFIRSVISALSINPYCYLLVQRL